MWKNRSIFQKMFLGIMLLMSITLISYYSFSVYYEYTDNAKTTMAETIELSEKINKAFQEYITQIEGTITSFYYELYQNTDGALASLLISDEKPSGAQAVWQRTSLDNFFSQLFLMRRDFVNVYVYRNEENNYFYSPVTKKKMNYVLSDSELYQKVLEKEGKTHITLNYFSGYSNYNKPVIGFSRMLKDVSNQGIAETTVVILEFTMKNLDDIIDNYITNDMTTVLLMDEQGNSIYQWGRSIEFSKKEQYILSSAGEQIYEWQIVIATDKDYIWMKTEDYLKFIVALGVLLIFVAVIVSYFFSRNLCQPIITLKRGMEEVQHGNFDIQIASVSGDEIGHLIDDFNCMAYKTKNLIKEKYEEELQKKDAQYKFLQAQIDPHFIFNTLQVISSMAIVNRVPEIEKASNSLAQLIRYSISSQQKTISLKEELKCVTNYLEIQKIRFKNRLSYEIRMEPELEHVKIIKLVLQPIIENAIRHGFGQCGGKGRIEINGRMEENQVVIDIRDNGIGMTEAETIYLMKKINEPLKRINPSQLEEEEERKMREQGNDVGLRNINLRMKMYYGEEYGVFIQSVPQKGTTVTVRIRREEM